MKLTRLMVWAAATLLMVACSGPQQTANYQVIPLPQAITINGNLPSFTLSKSTVITYPANNEGLERNAEFLQDYIEQLTGLDLKVSDKEKETNYIRLKTTLISDNPEAYTINVSSNGITINGASDAGVFYGMQTIRKSIPSVKKGKVLFPAVTIVDEPRFSYRGAHLDVSRHFFPADSVKRFIDILALHNINTLHWHLTDDQGWRIEIKNRPELTTVGSKRKGTVIGHNTGVYDSIPYGGFYTQEQARDIVKYAAERNITVIPEIDLPGHMLGALTAYPELGCTGGPYDVWQIWGVSQDVLCAGNDETYKFIDDVLGEIVDIFPSKYIHVGGDECPKDRWAECPKCQAKIKELGIVADSHGTKEEKLQSHVIHHASDFLASKGRSMIGWDETLEGGLAPGAIVMSWRGEEGGIEAAHRGHDVIMTPNNYLYFDYYQTLDREKEPDAIGGYVPVEKVYSYNPRPDSLPEEITDHIIGVQANLWTEYIPTFSQVEYMVLPRYAALAEVQWSNAPKDYKQFAARVPQLINQYEANGYNYARHMFNVSGKITPDSTTNTIVVDLSTVDSAPIHYTLDGSEPTTDSPLFSEPIKLKESTTVKARAFRPNGASAMFVDSVSFNKATSHPVTLLTEPHPRYKAQGGVTLTDGKFGTNGYANGDWVGFVGRDVVAVVDLGSEQQISEVAINTCVATGDWVFDARGMKVEVATKGTDFKEVASEQWPAMTTSSNEIVTHTLKFAPVEAASVRITVKPESSMPAWHPGAGRPGFVFIDEIRIN